MLKKWILQIQINIEKIESIGYLILGEIKFFSLKNENFSEKDPKKLKNITFYLHSTMLLLTGIKLLAVNWCRNWF